MAWKSPFGIVCFGLVLSGELARGACLMAK
ncbi:hypothetical protein B0I32_10515 [Nonomuraea fuscirosea]|uniref:Uncharacterized protein n=1 Tax=Nonomuraea fuscirosea TaxID=1291556 RepID=A0A2T0N336_9ACTN|nr:hypothetical protein B0I32_10515 [Nonomuraea fuscirosea]